MVFSTLSNSVNYYACQFAVQTLQQINAPLKIVIRDDGEEKKVYEGKKGRDEEYAVITINNPTFWIRLCSDFDLGFAEAYMYQEVDCDNLTAIFDLYINNPNTLNGGSFLLQFLPRFARLLKPKNDLINSRANIASHYDSSNDLFTAFLSPDMNYSCAHWSGDPSESLEAAQLRKVHSILHKAKVTATDHVLDIGCGWGGLAIEAARRTGCRVTGLTLSAEQKTLADEKIKTAGLEDRISILLCDYRNAPRPENGYDKIISVGMFEHVGLEFMDQYFETISGLLKNEQGIVVIDGITKTNPVCFIPYH
ncbi:hypothetical protein AWENTII_003108 [Aspergillus wentii]